MYTVTFSDGTTFEGGSPADSKWNEIPKKPIAEILYRLTPYIAYKFSGFENYNHMVEHVRGVNKSFDKITKVVIMGWTLRRVYQIVMCEDGSVWQHVCEAGKEYSPTINLKDGHFNGWDNGKPLSGWIKGVATDVGPRLEKIFTKEEACQ